MDSSITVIGSINMDLVIDCPKIPEVGETVLGSTLREFPGGKGANQAVAASRLGAKTRMVGSLGQKYGEELKENLKANSIHVEGVKILESMSSGLAFIYLDEEGNNSIMVLSGANARMDREMVEASKEMILESKILLLQLEIPLDTLYYILEMVEGRQIKVLFNPAPMLQLDKERLKQVDYLIMNEIETQQFLGFRAPPQEAIPAILDYGIGSVIITRGGDGSSYNMGREVYSQKAPLVEVVDTTGAGDTFVGALAAALYHGLSLHEGIQLATEAAAIAVTRLGAQTSMPYREEIEGITL